MTESPQRAMILAAGRGERLRPLTDRTPKPLLAVGGKPLIQHHVEALASAGMDRIVINLAWLGEQIRAYLGDGRDYGVRITYSEEAPRALETGGGIFRALQWLTPGVFAVVNGDVYSDIAYWRLALAEEALAHLILVPNPPHHAQGDFGFDGTHAQLRDESSQTYTFSGVAVYRENFFQGCGGGAFPLRPLLERAIRAHRVTAQVHDGLWEDVGTAQRLQRLDQTLRHSA